MYKFKILIKKCLTLFLSLALILVSAVPVCAKEEVYDYSDVYQDSVVLGEFRETDNNQRLVNTGIVRGSLVRSGNTNNVDLIIFWEGEFMVKGFRFTKLQVTGTSILNPVIYHTLYTGNYMTYLSSTFSHHVYITIARINIPTNVEKAKINVSALQVLAESGWLSGVLNDSTVTIK